MVWQLRRRGLRRGGLMLVREGHSYEKKAKGQKQAGIFAVSIVLYGSLLEYRIMKCRLGRGKGRYPLDR